MLAAPTQTDDLTSYDLTPDDLTLDDLTSADLTSGSLPDAACSDELPCWAADPELWFAESPADVEAAKALCAPCPLREACLAGALERREPWGVWGGQLLVAGVVVAFKRPRGRPRKNAPSPLTGAA